MAMAFILTAALRQLMLEIAELAKKHGMNSLLSATCSRAHLEGVQVLIAAMRCAD
jgi:hypothetical protein